jgi:choline monooxygenase
MEVSIPWEWYDDAEILRREQERIFRSSWQYAAHAGAVAEPRSYLAGRSAHVPIVVVRGHDERLRAFVNVCRHRGFPVARGSGRRETLQCGYHAWTYDLEGRLRSAPRSEREPGFDVDEIALAPAQVDTWGPFLFVNADVEAPPLAETLRDLPEQVASAGIDVDALEFRHRSEFAVEANWKVVSENFLECYHCPVAHPGFTRLIDVSPDAYRLEVGETFSSQFGPLRDGRAGAYDANGEVRRSQFHFIWPNTGINIFPGRQNLSIGPMLPAGPRRTERFLDYFFGPGVEEAWIEELIAFDDQVGREDLALVEGVQAGLGAGAIKRGRLLADSERLIVDFQRRVAAALTD